MAPVNMDDVCWYHLSTGGRKVTGSRCIPKGDEPHLLAAGKHEHGGIVERTDYMIPTISVVVLNYNTRELLRECLLSILENDRRGDLQLIVVDNASTDGSAAMVEGEFPTAVLVKNERNLGFAAGVNRGLALAGGEFVLVLNADTRLPPGFTEEMRAWMRDHPRVGIAGPMLVDGTGNLQRSFHYFTVPTASNALRFLAHLGGRYEEERLYARLSRSYLPVDWVYGACLFMRRELLQEVGLFDEGFFLYAEDMELCYRARLHGWEVAYLPGPRVVHYGNRSGMQTLGEEGSIPVLKVRMASLDYFLRKHFGPLTSWCTRLLMGTASLLMAGVHAPALVLPGGVASRWKKRCLHNLRMGLAAFSSFLESPAVAPGNPASGVRGEGREPRGIVPFLDAGPKGVPGSPSRASSTGGQPERVGPSDDNIPSRDRLVIVLAHNEEASVGRVVHSILSEVSADVLVIDDGSRDATLQEALKSGAECLALHRNMGIGAAEKAGFEAALHHGYRYVVRVDGDGQHPTHLIPALFSLLEERGVDLAVGSRYRDGYRKKGTFMRRLGTFILSSLVSKATGTRVTDATCGMRGYSRRAFRALLEHQPDGAPEISSLLIASRLGLRVEEIGIPVRERLGGSSHFHPLAMASYVLVNLWRIVYHRLGRYPLPR